MAARPDIPVTDPRPLPSLCPIEVVEGRGTWSNSCWQALEQYEIVAEGNTAIAEANANALRKSEQGYDYLIEAGKLQQQLAQIRQDLLDEERKAHKMDNIFYRVLIMLGLVGVAL